MLEHRQIECFAPICCQFDPMSDCINLSVKKGTVTKKVPNYCIYFIKTRVPNYLLCLLYLLLVILYRCLVGARPVYIIRSILLNALLTDLYYNLLNFSEMKQSMLLFQSKDICHFHSSLPWYFI